MPVVDWVRGFLGFGWIRDFLGIRKDLVDTKKSKLEVDKLEDEKRGRDLITRATLEDVKKYDPKYKAIKRIVIKNEWPEDGEYKSTEQEQAGRQGLIIYTIKWLLIITLFLILLIFIIGLLRKILVS